MGRPKASEGRQTRREILDAALELFAENGFYGTSLRDIARAVGVRESALYHHFASKEALFAAVASESTNEIRLRLAALVEGPLPVDLRATLESLLTEALERFATLGERKRFRIMASDGLRLAAAGQLRLLDELAPRTEMIQLMTRLVKEKRLQGDPEMLTYELVAPLVLWRVLQSVAPGTRFVTGYRSYVKLHVAHFLGAAAAAPGSRAVTRAKENGRSLSTGRSR